jgi:hypothetical protein
MAGGGGRIDRVHRGSALLGHWQAGKDQKAVGVACSESTNWVRVAKVTLVMDSSILVKLEVARLTV